MFSVNDLKNAVPCAASYMLFDPSDTVMKNNVAYYQFHKSQWELTEEDFLPRSVRPFMIMCKSSHSSCFCVLRSKYRHELMCVPQEAVRYYNQTTMQLQMLEFSRQRLVSDDEVRACFIFFCITGFCIKTVQIVLQGCSAALISSVIV